MSSIDWHNLRVWKGSQHAAFEEITCQLAATEPMPVGSKFIRKGAPDAGVECFWILPNGEEHGWQAKFFRASPDPGQWSQIDDSVKTALEKHPRLKQYTVCLPVDRPDPRRDDQTSFLDRWNERVRKWEEWATTKAMVVTFVFWGDHEIGLRLTREAHRGRLFYWFNHEKLSDRWFSERAEEAVSNVGPRYTPHLNVTLPVARLFDGLGRTERFYSRIDGLLVEVKKHFAELVSWTSSFPDRATIEALQMSFLGFLASAEAIDRSVEGPIDFPAFVRMIDEVQDFGRACVGSVYAAADATDSQAGEEQRRLGEWYRHSARKLDQFLTKLHGFGDFCEGGEARLASRPYLLLVGNAGTGKTHLFCDVAMSRIRAGLPTVLLNGTQFTYQEPWTQIMQMIGLDCTREEFLGALDALAEARGTRALLMIDALNEGEGKRIWKTHLAGVLCAVARFPRIGVALSVRTSYETVVVPPDLVPDRLHRDEHHGFEDHEFEAATAFFRHYNIAQPSVPLLVPEFRNPLFLKLFCEGLRNRGLSHIPPGLAGVTAIFDFFIESVEAKLSSPTGLDFDPASRTTRRAIDLLARRMADAGTTWLPRAESAAIVNQVLPRDGFERSLFRHLLSEGVLLEDRRYAGGEWKEVIHFCYERFSEHMIASVLLDDHLNPADIQGSFAPASPLGRYCASPQTSSLHQGLLNAFAVQLPERAGVELIDAAPHVATSSPLQTAFIESLLWRDPRATTPSTESAVAAILAGKYGAERRFELLNALVLVGTKYEHPFNADRLHEILWPILMAERDAWWSTYLHHQRYRRGAASVLIDWAGSSHSKTHVDDTAILRAATILTWCLSTPNRFVRDQATKALVKLLDHRIEVLRRLLDRFLGVNDPYVAERLHAVTLGCAMRSRDAASVAALGQDVYNQVFRCGTPPADIMLRAYARETVEESVRRGLSLSGDPSLIRPPYRSDWDPNVPPEDELRRRVEDTACGEQRPGVHALMLSVLCGGDFTRYVLGTNAGGVPWSSIPLSEPIEARSMRYRFDRFVKSLRPEQKKLWEEYTSLQTAMYLHQRIEQFTREASDEIEIGEDPEETADEIEIGEDPEETAGQTDDPDGGARLAPSPFVELVLDSMRLDVLAGLTNSERLLAVQRARAAFVVALDGDQCAEYEAVSAYPQNRHHYDKDDAFDASLVERWILHRVLEIGWRSDKHGSLDSTVQKYDRGRDAHKPERIGKKYQWIALHECYARLGDNFHFREDVFAEQHQEYRGTWQLSVLRDIDPTCTFTGAGDREPEGSPRWSLAPSYEWQRNTPDGEWLRAVEDFPDVRKVVSVVNPSNDEEWLVLRCSHSWEEPRLGPGRVAEYPFRRMYCLANAYLVSAGEYEVMYEWACQQDYMNRWMPECRDLYPLYYGEFYTSAAFVDTVRADPELFGWTRGMNERLPCAIAVPLVRYIREASGFDCSIDESVSLYLPAPMLVEGLGLSGAGREGRYVDRHGQLVALDTVTEESGADTFAVRRREFEEFLTQRDLRVFWTVLGGKDIIHAFPRDEEFLGQFVLNGSLRLDQDRVRGLVSATLYQRGGSEALGASEV